MPRWATAFVLLALPSASLLGLSISTTLDPAHAIPEQPTFTRDVAPIVFAHCAPCHHDGGAGPFPLISYADVRKRARQIATVTGERVMPPWPPVAGHGDFRGERRLGQDLIDTLARWVQQGAVEGAAGDAPPPPVFERGWQLGAPDLVLTAEAGWTLPAEGDDVFRNFVLPVPIASRRFVRAMEIRPGTPRLVHHANALLDRSGSGRARDAAEAGAGFAGMDLEIASDRFEPDSHFLFWKPGTAVESTSSGIPWVLEPGTDLILNLHLRTTGKPEQVQPSLGLYFTDRAPAERPMLLQLEHDGALDIPPGAREFVVSDQLELPVDVTVLAVYPHAHYVAREVRAIARRPDGTESWLMHIDDWNLDWQAVYELATPLALPRGSVLSMRWSYDNSDGQRAEPERAAQAGDGGQPRVRRDVAFLAAGAAEAPGGPRAAAGGADARAPAQVSGRLPRQRESRDAAAVRGPAARGCRATCAPRSTHVRIMPRPATRWRRHCWRRETFKEALAELTRVAQDRRRSTCRRGTTLATRCWPQDGR